MTCSTISKWTTTLLLTRITNKAIRNTLIAVEVIGFALASAGCVNTITPPEPTPSFTPTVEVATPTPTPTETITPQPTATHEVLDTQEVNKEAIVKNINDFISGEGVLSDDNLKEIIMVEYPPALTSKNRHEDLGLYEMWPEVAMVQGIILGEIRDNNDVWFYYGTKMGKDAQRTVIPIKIPFDNIEYWQPFPIMFHGSRILQSYDGLIQDDLTLWMKDPDEVAKQLDSLSLRPVILTLFYNHNVDRNLVRESVIKAGGTESDATEVEAMFEKSSKVDKDSFCDFHPVKDNLTSNSICGTGYKGVRITTSISSFDPAWLSGDHYISAFAVYTYKIDN